MALQDNTCANGIRDNFETDVDCGGPLCAPCADGKQCQQAEDCENQNCNPSGVCAVTVSSPISWDPGWAGSDVG